MALIDALQSATVRLVAQRPSAFFSSTNKMEMELCELATETAIAIAEVHDWRALTRLASIAGDGSKIEHDLPLDYDRMPKDVHVWSSAWPSQWLYGAPTLDEWYDITTQGFNATPGTWIILGGKFQVYPAIPSAARADFYYISDYIGANKDGAPIKRFGADTDTFAINDRLLTLGLVWRWRAQKRLEYAEDMANYEIALAEEIGSDKGSRVIGVGPRRFPGNVSTAWPGTLG